nr:hypothetical protein CFP56_07143 [Quercus suber]
MQPKAKVSLWAHSQGQDSPHGHVAKAKACSQGHDSPYGHAVAKAKLSPMGMLQPRARQPPMSALPRLGHAIAKVKASSQGKECLSWARATLPRPYVGG